MQDSIGKRKKGADDESVMIKEEGQGIGHTPFSFNTPHQTSILFMHQSRCLASIHDDASTHQQTLDKHLIIQPSCLSLTLSTATYSASLFVVRFL